MPPRANLTSPIILLIDTTQRDQTQIALIHEENSAIDTQLIRAQGLQRMVIQFLEHHKTTLHDISQVVVITGPGSFTGTRIGITFANTLNWLTRAPLSTLHDVTFSDACHQLVRSSDLPLTNTIKPEY